MNKSLFFFSLLSTTLLSLPILGMENQQEKEQTRSEAVQFLGYISKAMTDVKFYNKCPRAMQDIVLHLEGVDKQALDCSLSQDHDVPSSPEYRAHVEKIQELLKSEAAITAMANVFDDINPPETLANIIRNSATWTIPSFFGKYSASTPTTISITPAKQEKSLTVHRKKSMGTKKTHDCKKSKHTTTGKIQDILTAREYLMHLYPMTTFESNKRDFHCIFSDCRRPKKIFGSKKTLINHLTIEHQQEINTINETQQFDGVITAQTLSRIMNSSNNFKQHKRKITRSV